MPEIFRKGQIIPKRIGHTFVHRKARHLLTFGCDVEVNGNTWTAIKNNGKSIVNIKSTYRKHSNGTKQKVDVIFMGITFACEHLVDHAVLIT